MNMLVSSAILMSAGNTLVVTTEGASVPELSMGAGFLAVTIIVGIIALGIEYRKSKLALSC